MRPLIEIFVIALVIYAGWNQPFREHAAAVIPGLARQAPEAEATVEGPNRNAPPPRIYAAPPQAPAVSAAKRNDWMWEEKSMDRARPDNARVNNR